LRGSDVTLAEYLRGEASELPKIVERQARLLKESGVARASLADEHGLATGAGDSHAAAVYAQLVSRHNFMAADPYELTLAPPPNGRYLIAISVKGRTREVVKSVTTLKKFGWRALAVTAEPSSELARASDAVVRVSYGGGSMPVGVGNFASVLTVLTWILSGEAAEAPSPSKPVKELAEAIAGGAAAEVVTVGEGLGVVPAYFTCLKLYETLCMPCRSYSIEQFLHAPLYSLSKKTITVVFPDTAGVKSRVLQSILENAGLRYAVVTPPSEGGPLALVLGESAQAVLAIAEASEARGFKVPCFEERRDLLEASTPVIYG